MSSPGLIFEIAMDHHYIYNSLITPAQIHKAAEAPQMGLSLSTFGDLILSHNTVGNGTAKGIDSYQIIQ